MKRTAAVRLLVRTTPPCPAELVSINRIQAKSHSSTTASSSRGDRARQTTSARLRPTVAFLNRSSTCSALRNYGRTTSPSLNSNAKRAASNADLSDKFGAMIPPSMGAMFGHNRKQREEKQSSTPGLSGLGVAMKQYLDASSAPDIGMEKEKKPHHFHVYAHRHNTHITVTDPNRNPIISLSCGNIGFKHSGRKQYDSAFQLASYVMGRMQEYGINMKIEYLELVLRGFGPGREAVTKALLGTEGRYLRGKVISVKDATRLKFGGTRSPRPRRLG